jgi:hypothetical protein
MGKACSSCGTGNASKIEITTRGCNIMPDGEACSILWQREQPGQTAAREVMEALADAPLVGYLEHAPMRSQRPNDCEGLERPTIDHLVDANGDVASSSC